ncbi:MAG: hypothetical protein QXF52_02185 [Thermoproteota archaeon]
MDRLKILFLAGLTLTLAGFIILLLAFISGEWAIEGVAFVVFIGPLFLGGGFGEYSPILLLTSVIIAVATILIILMSVRRWKMEKEVEEKG